MAKALVTDRSARAYVRLKGIKEGDDFPSDQIDFTAGTPGHWTSAPADVAAALDQLAARVRDQE